MSGANNLIEVTSDDKARYEEYEELLVKRDQLFKEAGSLMTAYTAEFGDMITANFELKVECIKKKKTISYCRRRLNRGLAIDTDRMQAEIDQEMTLYYTQLKDMASDTQRAKEAENVGQFRFNRAKKIYHRLAKLLHPDINKKTMENETLKELWTRIVNAYHKSDVDELDDLEVLARKAMDEMGEAAIEIDYTGIEDKIERVEHQINDILTTEPYTYKELFENEEKKSELKASLQAEHDDYEQYLETLTKTLEEMLKEVGVKFVWKMN